MVDGWQAGWARGDITPPLGIAMGGYWGRTSGALAVHDPLAATVLVLASGKQRAVLVALDLVGLDAATIRQIRRLLTRHLGLDPRGIMVCCSHTHAGPLTMGFRGMGDLDQGYLDQVVKTVVDLAADAIVELAAVELGYGRVPVQIGINRRLLRRGEAADGLVVPYAHILQINTPNGKGLTLFNHACHPVVLGNANHSISAEFPGAAVRCVEDHTGGLAVFINGACGDINPRTTGADFAVVEALGRQLGQAVLAGLGDIRPLEGDRLRYLVDRLELPLMPSPPALSLGVERSILRLKAQIAKHRAGGDKWAQLVPRAHLEWALELQKLGPAQSRSQVFEVQALGIGGLCLLGMEGEIFARYQLDLEQGQSTVLCGFANGCIGYVPTADEYQWGGYEIDEAYKVYPTVQMIAPQSEALIRQRAAALVEEVSKKP